MLLIFGAGLSAVAAVLIIAGAFYPDNFDLGLAAGVFIIFGIYLLSMGAYFLARKKRPAAKYIIEILTVAVAAVFSFTVKLIIALNLGSQTFISGLTDVFSAVYASFGGFAFEGLSSDVNGLNQALLECLYAGSGLYAALMFVSVITVKASYEIYSGILLLSLRLKVKFVSTDVYVFTCVTEDSLQLAKSVVEKSPCKCKILFAGDEIGAFDRKNPLHREIMANGYIYWSYAKNEKRPRSIPRRFGLYINNDVFGRENTIKKINKVVSQFYSKICQKSKRKDCRIHVFAFANNKELSGLERRNCGIVLDEIRTMTGEMCGKTCRKRNYVNVDFYILTDNEINYEYYHDVVKAEVNMVIKNVYAEGDIEKYADAFSKCFDLHVVSEAEVVSKMFVEQRNELGNDTLVADVKDDVYRTMVIGFGSTGQKTMMQAYVMSVDCHDCFPTKFEADVFDNKMDEIGGVFELKHPLMCCVTADGKTDKEIDDNLKIINDNKIKHYYSQLCGTEMKLDKARFNKLTATADCISGQMKLPAIKLHNCSCFDTEFIDYLDSHTGRGAQRDKNYNLIIVALGDDEANIKITNALLADIKHELKRQKQFDGKHQTIAVNIRNEENYGRINWNDDDKKSFELVHVIIFGRNTEIYSYGQIVDETEAMRYNHAYRIDDNPVYEEVLANMLDAYNNGVAAYDYKDCLTKLNGWIKEGKDNREEWKTVCLFEKESNKSAALYKGAMAALYEAAKKTPKTDMDYKMLLYLAQLEHERWNRFYIASGWTFSPKKDKPRKEHDCLIPTSLVRDDKKKFDIVNVARVFEK